jgi:hypothetical protein
MNNTFKLAAVSSAALMLAAAPALAQEGPTLKLGGFYDQKMSIQNNDGSAGVNDNLDVRNDVEIYFLGGVTLDNGIKIATRVELEGGTNGDLNPDPGNVPNSGDTAMDQIDEAFMTISGSFGSVKLGMADTAAKSMTTRLQGTWASNVGENITFNSRKLFVKPATVTARSTPAAQMDGNSDGEQISYTTPSFAGFQVSGGYAKNATETFDGVTNPYNADSDIMDIAARYTGKIGNVGFNLGGGYMTANELTVGREDSAQWMFGGNVRVGAFQVAASYSMQEETKNTSGAIDIPEVGTIEMGVRAWMGPNEFSLSYSRSEAKSRTAAIDGDEESIIAAAMRRKLGKGVTWHNTVYYYDAQDGDPSPAANAVTKMTA